MIKPDKGAQPEERYIAVLGKEEQVYQTKGLAFSRAKARAKTAEAGFTEVSRQTRLSSKGRWKERDRWRFGADGDQRRVVGSVERV